MKSVCSPAITSGSGASQVNNAPPFGGFFTALIRKYWPDAEFQESVRRIFSSLASVRSFRALGAIPTPIPAPEIYSALQSDVVDAMDGTIPLVAVAVAYGIVTRATA